MRGNALHRETHLVRVVGFIPRSWAILICALATSALFSVPTAARAQAFSLSGVAFDASDYLDEAVLQASVAPYLNRSITFADVQSMVADVQALYAVRGIVTAQVVIEPQDVVDGVLRLTLVEAAVEAVDVSEVPDTNPDFLTRRLTLNAGAKPDFEQIARDLRLFDVAYDIRPQLSFGRGEAPGMARATISAKVPEKRSWVVSLDNSASDALGAAKLSIGGTFRSLTGQRDTLAAKLELTQGSQTVSLDYARPVGLRGGVLSAQGSYGHSKIVSGDFSIIDVETTDYKATLAYAQPFAIRPDRYWRAYGRLSYERTESQVASNPLQSSDLAELDLGVRYTRQDVGKSWVISGGAKLGQASSDAGSVTDGSYALVYADVSHARRLGERWVLGLSANLQFAEGQNLPVKRRISAGGLDSLRGFEADARLGDSGLIASVEMTCGGGCWSPGAGGVALDPFVFLDVGYVKPFTSPGATADTDHALASLGAGLNMRWKKANLLAFVGAPVLSPDSLDPDPMQFYVGVDYTF